MLVAGIERHVFGGRLVLTHLVDPNTTSLYVNNMLVAFGQELAALLNYVHMPQFLIQLINYAKVGCLLVKQMDLVVLALMTSVGLILEISSLVNNSYHLLVDVGMLTIIRLVRVSN